MPDTLQSKLNEAFSSSNTKMDTKILLRINPSFIRDLEDSVKKSMDRSGTLWARSIRRDMGRSGTDGRRSRPGQAPAIQSTALAMSIGHKHDVPKNGKTLFTMYVGSVGRQRLRRVPKQKSKPSSLDRLKSMLSRARRAIGKFGRKPKRKKRGATKSPSSKGRALPHEYGYWLEYGNNKTAPGGERFNVPFEARPWAGPGSTTHRLWVEGRYFLQDFREGMSNNLRKYLR